MRILIADDNEMIRRGIAGILSTNEHYEICGEAVSANDMLRKAGELNPDLVLLDVSMPDMDGLNAARLLHKALPSIKIVIVSQHDAKHLLPRALETGAHGFVDKARLAKDLLPAVAKIFNA